ncbi:phosphomannomutase/phosphoglucomutase [Asaia astilbis]
MDTLFRHEFHPSILREYDIRGIVGETLFENDARALGVVFSSVLRELGKNDVVIGHDGRLSSPALEQALLEGLLSGGMSVTRLGCCPTPELYFTSVARKASGAIMVTGSHNPIGYNGFKIMLENQPFFGKALQELACQARQGVAEEPKRGGAETLSRQARASYEEALADGLSAGTRPLRIVWDNSHSSAGEVLARLVERLPGVHLVLNGAVDGLFPAHHPDPTLPENMVQLQCAVRERHADIGFAFDGDADRLGVVDEKGAIIPADRLSLLLARAIIADNPDAVILADVKMSQTLFDGVVDAGGKVDMCPSGHSEVKRAMRRAGASFAGEMSGHFFFADRWSGFDDGLYAAIRVMDFLSRQERPLSELCDALPQLVATPEIRFECADEQKFSVIERVTARCAASGEDMTTIDGIRVREKGGWWLLRASNTQPALVARAEGRDHETCGALIARIAALLEEEGLFLPQIEGFPIRSQGSDPVQVAGTIV